TGTITTLATSLSGNAGGATDFTISGAIVGPGGFQKDGPNTVTLSATNTYTGGTTVNAGTLKLGSSAALPVGGAVTMNGAVTLDLNGQSPSVGDLNFNFSSAGVITNGTGGVVAPATLTTNVSGS